LTEETAPPRAPHLTEAVQAPIAAAAALWDQRGRLRLIGDVAPSFPRIVATGVGASFAVARSFRVALSDAGIEAMSLPVAALVREPGAYLDGRSILVVVGRSGDAAPLVSLASAVGGLHARPFIVAVTAAGGSEIADLADVALAAGVEPDAGPPLRVPLATSLVLSAVLQVLAAGAHADVDAVVAATESVAARAAAVGARLVGMADEREAALAATLGGRGGLLVLGRGAGRASAELAGLLWLTSAGRVAHVMDAAEARLGTTEAAGPDLAALVFSPGHAGAALSADRALGAELVSAGSAVVFVGHDHEAPMNAQQVVVGDVDPVMDPILAALVAAAVGCRVGAGHGRPAGGLVRTDPAVLA
jgi:fructoselysine-6-P-deglycase FrlB-like protein